MRDVCKVSELMVLVSYLAIYISGP